MIVIVGIVSFVVGVGVVVMFIKFRGWLHTMDYI